MNDVIATIGNRRMRLRFLREEISSEIQANSQTFAKHIYSEWARVQVSMAKSAGRETIDAEYLASMYYALGLKSHARLSGVTEIPDEYVNMRTADSLVIRAITSTEALTASDTNWFVTPDESLMNPTEDETCDLSKLTTAQLTKCRDRLWEVEKRLRKERDRVAGEVARISQEHSECVKLSLSIAFAIKIHSPNVPISELGKLSRGIHECRSTKALRTASQSLLSAILVLLKISEVARNPFTNTEDVR